MLKKGYQDDEMARKSFNQLAGQIFGLDLKTGIRMAIGRAIISLIRSLKGMRYWPMFR